MRITVVDVIVIVLLGLSLFSFSTKYNPKYEFGYSGSQIYKVVKECDDLDSKGFLYTVYVDGFWNNDITEFTEEGFVCDTGRGHIVLVLEDGTTVTVGGLMSYKEDIQAKRFEIRLRSKSSVMYLLKPVTGSREEIKEYIESSSQFIFYKKEDIAVSCVFTIQSNTESSILLESEIEDVIRRKVFFMKSVDVEIYDDGIQLAVERLSMKAFDDIFRVLEEYFDIQGIYTGDISVFYQTAEEIKVEDIDALESYEGDGVYPGYIHVRV
ncbi:MAG: hypothetical protein HXS46_14595 [Theionarchaea archaeon]|nr:hypothetical protein [Theionarchaea archaeon]